MIADGPARFRPFQPANGCRRCCRAFVFLSRVSVCRFDRHDRFAVLELLSARLCHELSGPIAAISNGVELLAEEDPGLGLSTNPAFLHDAVALVSESARRARCNLQICL